MKLTVYEIWGDAGTIYSIKDEETDTRDVVDVTFISRSEAQSYLDIHRAEIERKGLPPLLPEEVEFYWQDVEFVEGKLDAGDLQIEKYWRKARHFIRLARQPVPLAEAPLRRLELVIARLNFLAEHASAEANKSAPDAKRAETMLKLARDYFELGDREGALSVLDEILQQCDDVYKDRARKMIREFLICH